MRTPADLPRRMPRTSRRFRIGVLIAIVVVIIVLSTARGVARFYTSYLWFHQVHFESVFRGVLLTRVLLGLAFCVIFFLAMMASLVVADRFAPQTLPDGTNDELVERYRESVLPRARPVRLITAIIFALLAGVGANAQWNNWDLFRYHTSFGVTDPQFHRDIGFYVFQLPFIKFLPGWGFGALIVILLVTLVAQYLNGGIRFQGPRPRVTAAVKAHLSVLLGILALIQGFNYYLARLQLVLSNSHVVTGATATDVHANLPAYELLMAIAVIAAVLFIVNIRVKGWTLPIVGTAVWAIVWLLVGNIYPALYQSLRVDPAELARETPYIGRNIDATRAAYGLTNVKTVSNFDSNPSAGSGPINGSDLVGSSASAVANRETLANVQLLDPTQVTPTVNTLQKLRRFYSINNLSVDRYSLDVNGHKTLTETVTGVRELNEGGVPPGFTTQHLQYTHGYGAAVAPATQGGVNANGEPSFSLQDMPPSGTPSLSDRGAQVYYGEGASSSGFVIADSKQEELDYQAANGTEIQGHYTGSGGVRAGGLIRRAIFSVAFDDPDILLSGQVTPSSRIIYNRNVTQMVQKAAPFLKYDADPYSVILGNQLYWVDDAYTTTANYPYSQDADTSRVSPNSGLSGTFNYVRNSVKVVVNAYTGKMYFFVVDQADPIIQVYEKAFPGLFTPVAQADKKIPGITSHWRYPEDLFDVQTNMYGRYHLTNVGQFFSQANAWAISQDPGSGRPDTPTNVATTSRNGTITFAPKLLDPQYELAALPGQTVQSFVAVQPFVPASSGASQKNLTGVMFASSDPSDYGQLTVYETPPSEQIDGPQLVQSEIASNPFISQKLTLLNQQGSQVLLGEVVTVPIANTLLYVQPVYVQASSNHVPELKDVIVVYNHAAYQSNNASLDAALCTISNPDGSQPFAQYCNTAAAKRKKTPTPTPSTSPNSSSTTAPPNASTSTPPSSAPATTAPPTTNPSEVTVPAHATVQQLLSDADAAYNSAEAALKRGDLSLYQADIRQAHADVKKAQQELKGP